MSKAILAGVGNIELRNGSTGQIIATSTTLTDSGIAIDVSAEDIRGGQSAKLIGRYFHSSNFNLNLTDAVFSLEYIALNVGGSITVGGEALTTETVTTTVANTITVTGSPIAWNGMTDIVGWYYDPSEESVDWHKITFTGQSATVSGITVGTTLCVKYNTADSALRELVVPTTIIPSTCYATLTIPMFSVGEGDFSSASKIGDLVVDIPRFQLSGAQDLSLTSTGAATTALTGSALAAHGGSTTCDESGYYAKIKEIISGRTMEDGLVEMLISGGNFSIVKDNTKQLKVIGLYEDGSTGTLDVTRLTFTVSSGAGSVAASTGIYTAPDTATSGTISVTATNKTTVSTSVSVTITAS